MLMRWLNFIGDIMSNVISSKKLEANRRNALKSTGPKTKEGKFFASQNAFVPPQPMLSAVELQKQIKKKVN